MAGITRNTLRSLVRPERLEDRRCFNVDIGLGDGGHSLMITGDRSDNQIDIVQDQSGVYVTADHGRIQTFNGIRNITLSTEGGDDVVNLRTLIDPNIRPIDVDARLGSGDDTFNAEIGSGASRISLDTGSGDDAVTLRSIIDPNIRSIIDPNFRGVDFTADLGAGDDTFKGEIVAHTPPSEHAPPSDHTPPSDRIAVVGGAGDDEFHFLISSGEAALVPAVLVESVDVRFDGGAGSDRFESVMRNVVLQGSVRVEAQGQAGNDAVMSMFDRVSVKGGLDMILGGGEGDDLLSLLALSQTRSEAGFVPALVTTSRARILLDGGNGNDQFIGDITPCVLPQGTLDMVFASGRGNDDIRVKLTMEPTIKSPSLDGSVRMSILGGEGNDSLNLLVNNLRESGNALSLRLYGGPGEDNSIVSAGIDASGWASPR